MFSDVDCFYDRFMQRLQQSATCILILIEFHCFGFFVQLSYLRVFRDVKVWESRAVGKPQSSESTDVDCFGLTAGLWRCSGTNHTLRLTN